MGETGVCEAVRAVEYEPEWASSPKIIAVWDGSGLILMGLGQEGDREGEVVSWEAASSAPGRVAMNCRKAPFAAIAQDFGRHGLHFRTKKVIYLYFQNPDVPPPARRFRQGDGRFDAPPNWAERSQGRAPVN